MTIFFFLIFLGSGFGGSMGVGGVTGTGGVWGLGGVIGAGSAIKTLMVFDAIWSISSRIKKPVL